MSSKTVFFLGFLFLGCEEVEQIKQELKVSEGIINSFQEFDKNIEESNKLINEFGKKTDSLSSKMDSLLLKF